MTEPQQIAAVIAAAHIMPKKIAAIVDSKGKEERFLSAFRAALPEVEFDIKVMDLTTDGKVRAIFIERRQARDPSSN